MSSLRDLCLLWGDFQKNEAIELLWIDFATAMVLTDIPVKEGEKRVTIVGYWIFVGQEEDGH